MSTSVGRGVIGFLASLVLGTLIGLAMWRSRWVRAAIGPIVSGLQSLPSVAWVPAAIIWFGLSTVGRIRHVMLPGALPGYHWSDGCCAIAGSRWTASVSRCVNGGGYG